MSDFSSPRGTSQPKQISNRLLNMKFMQRAAASTPQGNTTTPSIASYEPAPKRRRTGDFQDTANALNTPITPVSATSPHAFNNHTPALGSSSVGLNGHIARHGTNNFDMLGEETEWVLDVKLPATDTVNRTHAKEEGDDEDEHDSIWSSKALNGRQTYGSFKKNGRKSTNGTATVHTTPGAIDVTTSKRGRSDDEDLSSIPSDMAPEASSDEGEIDETPQPKRRKGKYDFKSNNDLKRMDASDLRRGGDQGFGRQRLGLSGGGAFGPSHQSHKNQGQGKRKKKVRKTM